MDLNKKHLQRSLLASSIAAVVTGVMSLSAHAQDENTVVEEVVVTGIRQSLENAMDIKRDSQGVVDAISAEDIGKMPDTNLAESLQRITGVSIDRRRGEGSRVTVRGFGPDYNLITLNGRQMPNAAVENTSGASTRAFDFSALAAEAVAGIEVYKSGRANLNSGGVGSLINIKTAKPLDNPGLNASFGVKALTDTSNKVGSDTTPELSGIFSNTFADDTIGVALTASYSARNQRFNTAEAENGWNAAIVQPSAFNTNADGSFALDGNGNRVPTAGTEIAFAGATNAPSEGELVGMPQSFKYALNDVERKRTNAQLTLQWQPSESVKTTLDYTYSELDLETTRHETSTWFNGAVGDPSNQAGTIYSDPVNGVVAPLVFTQTQNVSSSHAVSDYGRLTENSSVGFNVQWDATERLMLEFDYHDSTAEIGAKDDRGTHNIVTFGIFNAESTAVDFRNGWPRYTVNRVGGQAASASDILGSGTTFRNAAMETNIEQAQFKGTFEFDDDSVISSVDFGLSIQSNENRTTFGQNGGGDWGGAGRPADGFPLTDSNNVFTDSAFTPVSVSSEFDHVSDIDTPIFIIDQAQAFSDYAAIDSSYEEFCGEGRLCVKSTFDNDRRIKEEQSAVYTQAHFDWETADLPMYLTVGVRYEETDVTSAAILPNYTGQTWNQQNQFNLIQDTSIPTIAVTEEGSYSNFLPNIDFSVDVTENVKARASFSETMARPRYNELAVAAPANNEGRTDFNAQASGGDANLKPLESTNWDFSAEWYYDEASYVSVGYYKKDVKNFIGSASSQEVLNPLLFNPATGELYQQAVNEVTAEGSQNIGQDAWNWFKRPENGYLDNDGNWLVDPSTLGFSQMTYRVSRFSNEEEASIDGMEIAVQHMFGDSGFGVIANYTTVSGDVEYDVSSQSTQFALLGLSDSANFVAFYDKNGIQVRAAYNWRDDFLTATQQGGGQNEPQFVEAYGQLDVNASYEINDNLSVFAEGINVLDADARIHGRHESMLVQATQTGPLFNIGARYNF